MAEQNINIFDLNDPLIDEQQENNQNENEQISTGEELSQKDGEFPNKKRTRTGLIYDYFDILINGKAKCTAKTCSEIMSCSTTVLKRHLERKHRDRFREFNEKVNK